jgi:serine protease Do
MSLAPGRMPNRVSLVRRSLPLASVAALLLAAAAPAPASPARHDAGESVGYNGEEDGPAAPGSVARSRLGLSVQSVNADLAEALGLHSDKGAVVTAVLPGGPGEEAGVKRGDVILRVDDAVVRNAEGLAAAFSGVKPGRETDLTLMRGIKTLELSITPRPMPPAARGAWDDEDRNSDRDSPRGERLGVKVADPDRWLRRRYGIAPGEGVVVLNVAEGSRAQAAGILEGDLIIEADRRGLRNANDLLSAVAHGRKRGKLLLAVRRGDDVLYVPIRFN